MGLIISLVVFPEKFQSYKSYELPISVLCFLDVGYYNINVLLI